MVSRSCARRLMIYSIPLMYQMSGIFHRNIVLMLDDEGNYTMAQVAS
jgi:hypothetical protein